MKMIEVEDIRSRLARAANPDHVWLCCGVCQRFFQYENACHDGCPFEDCTAYGHGIELLWWDDLREPDDPRWPKSTEELEHGMEAPDMEPFYAAQLTARIHAMVSTFARSPEVESLPGGSPPRYLSSFLKMMSDLCWDLTEPDDVGFAEHLARDLIGEVPVWSQTADPAEALFMTAELRAFFAFARRTGAVKDAAAWLAFVTELDLDHIFRHTMETDRRLRQLRRPAQANQRPTTSRRRQRAKRRRRRARIR